MTGNSTPSSIVSITVRYGALVDSVTLHLSSGESIRSGGPGGGEVSTINIPEGCKVIGFYGGLGGHFHHFGVVVAVSATLPASLSPANPLSIELLQLIQSTQLSNCGMLGGVEFGKVLSLPSFLFFLFCSFLVV